MQWDLEMLDCHVSHSFSMEISRHWDGTVFLLLVPRHYPHHEQAPAADYRGGVEKFHNSALIILVLIYHGGLRQYFLGTEASNL